MLIMHVGEKTTNCLYLKLVVLAFITLYRVGTISHGEKGPFHSMLSNNYKQTTFGNRLLIFPRN